MSRSYRTQKESVIARRRAERDKNGLITLPRIVERKPFKNDIHPLSKRAIAARLRHVPEEYIYGLKRIELRARNGEIGCPFAYYSPVERTIVLYSLPLIWEMPELHESLVPSIEYWDAVIAREAGSATVEWPDRTSLACWFVWVLWHELGHHYCERYKTKRKKPSKILIEEMLANLHVDKLEKDLYRRYYLPYRKESLSEE